MIVLQNIRESNSSKAEHSCGSHKKELETFPIQSLYFKDVDSQGIKTNHLCYVSCVYSKWEGQGNLPGILNKHSWLMSYTRTSKSSRDSISGK